MMKLLVFGEIDGERTLVGTVETASGSEEHFRYDSVFEQRHSRAPLSVALPVQKNPFDSRPTRIFFKNLLPEGEALAAVARELEVRSTSYLQVLQAVGRECVGAISIIDEGEPLDVDSGYRSISKEELRAIASGDANDFARIQVASKLSLAGAQSKLGFYCVAKDGEVEFSVPYGDTASTHIVKASNRRFSDSNENEYCCLKTAAACGLRVPDVWIEQVGSGSSLLVLKRFDRMVEASNSESSSYAKVKRLHQEDFCQILGKLPERKYERPGQSYAKEIASAIVSASSDPVRDLNDFAKLLIFNAVIGNCDGHIKNIGLLRNSAWTASRLTPVYDIASTVVYENLDRHMAMRIGNSTKIDELEKSDILQFACDIHMTERRMLRNLDEVLTGAHDAVKGIVEEVEESSSYHLGKPKKMVEFALSAIRRLSR